MNTTTRRFARTMTEAFGPDAYSANPIEHHKRTVPDWLQAVAIALLIAAPSVVMVVLYPHGV